MNQRAGRSAASEPDGPRTPASPPQGASPAEPPDATSAARAQQVRQILLDRGFDRVGFATAGRAPDAARFDTWVDRGFGGDMTYLWRNRDRRLDPREIVPGARSVIVAALHYDAGDDVEAAPDVGVVSRYARGTDYHRVIERRLKLAATELKEAFRQHAFRYYVDTGPVLERAWAQAAGVAWIGKNTCAIDSQRGSYFFLGSIITTLDLPADAPQTNHCGSCALCLEACPTDAFAGPFELDARRCISYLNIEHRGPIEPELREELGNLVFGCDICQEVCPFNRSTESTGDPELAPREENRAPPLAELAALENADAFRERFPRSAVRRSRFEGFARNVATAIGNSGRRELLPLLDDIEERLPATKETVQWARKRLQS